MPTSPEEYARYIKRLYAEAEEVMLGKVARRLHRGVDRTGWAEEKLAEVSALNKELGTVVGDLRAEDPAIKKAIEQAGRDGAADAIRELAEANLGEPGAKPGRSQAVRVLAREVAGGVETARAQALRACLDTYREVQSFAAGQVLTGTMTIREAVKQALDRWADAGVTGFRDAAGRQWGLSSYAEMAVRTATSRARIQGHEEKLLARGHDLVRVSDSPSECPLCRPWERRVLSLTGDTPGYPTKAEAIAAGLWHSNCTHRHALWVPGVSRDRVPQSNPVGYEQRQDQRKIERDIRRWKRRAAVAGTDSDRAVAERKVRFYQARMRGFIGDTGRLRQRDREQLRLPVTNKINLRSETPQVVAWPRDMRPLYQGKPGRSHAAPRPVVYPVHRMGHIREDHPRRVAWIEANTGAIRDAIERPEIVYSEPEFHRKTRHYHQVCASRLVVPNGKHTHVVAVLSLGQPGKEDVHDLWTVFTCKDSYLYENSGGVAKLKSKYRRVAP